MMSIDGASFYKICGYGFQNPKYLDDLIWIDSYMDVCVGGGGVYYTCIWMRPYINTHLYVCLFRYV